MAHLRCGGARLSEEACAGESDIDASPNGGNELRRCAQPQGTRSARARAPARRSELIRSPPGASGEANGARAGPERSTGPPVWGARVPIRTAMIEFPCPGCIGEDCGNAGRKCAHAADSFLPFGEIEPSEFPGGAHTARVDTALLTCAISWESDRSISPAGPLSNALSDQSWGASSKRHLHF